ncbi:eukaryotic translation initiation factor 2A-like isoform X1 [Pomacea canaliculata]|uniref:eukaryotic translation initiation factor 2A-like isoform X1 n=2 Tax=Pomacea canaliculata TaxID=400727 RepID=UPI000D73EFC0|nr:eukaryotic translation initiation factor 2A-like isoform X1 [Pomacea canaliculata]
MTRSIEADNMAASFALRGSEGVKIFRGPPNHDPVSVHVCDESKTCKAMAFSSDGRFFAWANIECVFIMDAEKLTVCHQLNQPKVTNLMLSPRGNTLVTLGPYFAPDRGGGEPNLLFWNVQTGAIVKSYTFKKSYNWEPKWSGDDEVCAVCINNELHFYEKNNFEILANKLHLQKVTGFCMAEGTAPYMVSVYVAGAKGQPSFVRVYQYPNFGGQTAAIANKSFYKADRVHMYWNKAGTGLVILTSTESSDSSYYGEQGLHYIGVGAGESCLVPLAKNGPVYSVMWSPLNTEFCVVYGYMPSKATLFNLKCEPIFDFGTGPRNHCFYNPHGNILCLSGFGNLAGHVEFWDVKQHKQISQFKAADTTSFLWSPDGEHILTATTAPRLRVNNGYKLWHYTGSLLATEPVASGNELWEATWRPAAFSEKPVRYKPAEPGLAMPEAQKTEAYRPPQARGSDYKPLQLHQYEPASNPKQPQATIMGTDKAVSKNKKKREARKAKSSQEGEAKDQAIPDMTHHAPSDASNPTPTTGNPEVDKKIRNIRKKLQQIEKLKEQLAAGKQLEVNQMEKLKTEDALVKELEDLEIG